MPGQLIRGVAQTAVVAGTATAVSNRVSRRQAGRWAAADQAHPHSGYQYRPVPAGTYYGRYQWPMFQQHAAQHAQQAVSAPPPPPPAPAAVSNDDDMTARLAQLQRLGQLKAQGALTDAEFEAQKASILGG